MDSTRRLAAVASMAALLGLGCESDRTSGGELGAGKFWYECAESSDAQCDVVGDRSSEAFDALVVDGMFGLRYEELLADGFGFYTRGTRFEVGETAVGDGVYQQAWVREPGYVALVAYDLSAGGVTLPQNVLHAQAFAQAGVDISQEGLDGAFSGSVGGITVSLDVEDVVLRVAPINEAGDLLAGSLDCMWSSSDPDVAERIGRTKALLAHRGWRTRGNRSLSYAKPTRRPV